MGDPERPPRPRALAPARPRLEGRAIAGGLLVAVAMAGVAWTDTSGAQPPRPTYVVATDAVAPGSSLTAAQVRLEPMAIPDDVAASAFQSVDDLAGTSVLTPLEPGDLVQEGDVTFAGRPGSPHELSFTVPTDRAVGGRIGPGEVVDLVATYGTGVDAYTLVVATAEVLAVEESTQALEGGETTRVTVALSDRPETMAAAHAADVGVVRLVRSPPNASAPDETSVYRPPGAGPSLGSGAPG